MDTMTIFRNGLVRTKADPLFGLAWQGSAAGTMHLIREGLVRDDRVEVVSDVAPLGRPLTAKGEQIARRMRS